MRNDPINNRTPTFVRAILTGHSWGGAFGTLADTKRDRVTQRPEVEDERTYRD